MKLTINIPIAVSLIRDRIKSAGGTCLLVGGAVVDAIKGNDPKDWDIEVFGKSYDDLILLLADLSPNEVGKDFGILKLSAEKCDGLEIDINVPRRDSNMGVGHKDFSCEFDPSMTIKEAAKRRDFTINSLALDLGTMEVADPFGGLADLENGILRATDPETFVEDPLRALRAMQLLPRKAKTVDANTMLLIKGMVDSFPHLPQERVYEEFKKLLLKAEKPSIGLTFLRDSGWLQHFPELGALIGCGQNPEWHPEGDVWVHSLEVTDSASWVRDNVESFPEDWREAFAFAALLHDVGKPSTTVFPELVDKGEFPAERLWTAHGHDKAGVAPAEMFMKRITRNKTLIERVGIIVREHMQPYQLFQGEAKGGAWKRLHGKIRLDVIGWQSKCDHCGRPERKIDNPDLGHKISEHCFSRFDDLGAEPVAPILQGRDLIAAGIKPGKHMGVALKAAHEAQLDDESLSKEDLLEVALAENGALV